MGGKIVEETVGGIFDGNEVVLGYRVSHQYAVQHLDTSFTDRAIEAGNWIVAHLFSPSTTTYWQYHSAKEHKLDNTSCLEIVVDLQRVDHVLDFDPTKRLTADNGAIGVHDHNNFLASIYDTLNSVVNDLDILVEVG